MPDARQLSDEVLQALRLRALRDIELGLTEAQVADLLGVSRETVCRWWSAYADRGLDALFQERSGRPLGSGRFLSDQQARHIQDLIDQNNPEDLGIASTLWSRLAVRDLIRREFDIKLAVRTAGGRGKAGGVPGHPPQEVNRRVHNDLCRYATPVASATGATRGVFDPSHPPVEALARFTLGLQTEFGFQAEKPGFTCTVCAQSESKPR